jgi:hypothetical protein
MTDPYAETDDWIVPATRPHSHAQPVSAPEPSGSTPEAGEGGRVARYAEAIDHEACRAMSRCNDVHKASPSLARAVMAVADQETADLRAEVARLDAHYRDWQACLTDEYRKAAETWDRQRERLNRATDGARMLQAQAEDAETAATARAEAAEAESARLASVVAKVEALAHPDVTWRCSACGWVASESTIDLALWHEANRTVAMVCPECDEEGSFVDHDPLVEQVSADVHEAWMKSKWEQGVTSRPSETGEEQMVPYAELSERAKDLDRASVTAVLDSLRSVLASVGVSGSADDRREANASQAPDTATPGEAGCRGEGETCLTHGGGWIFNDDGTADVCESADLYRAASSADDKAGGL